MHVRKFEFRISIESTKQPHIPLKVLTNMFTKDILQIYFLSSFVSTKTLYKDSFPYFSIFGSIKKNESKENDFLTYFI